MRTRFACRRRTTLGALAMTAALAAATTATAVAASPAHSLPAAGKKLTTCHTTLFKVGGRLPVHTAFATQTHKHPAKALLSCSNADAVAKAGKADYHAYPFGLGKKVHVNGVTYTMGRTANIGGQPSSGPIYGWAGGGVVIYLLNPTG